MHAESPVAAEKMEERMAVLRSLAEQKVQAHRSRFPGRSIDSITLHTSAALEAKGRTAALSENFLPVEIEGKIPANRLVSLRVTDLSPDATLLTSYHP